MELDHYKNLEIGFTGTSVDNGTKMTCDQSLCQDITLLQENSNYNLLGFDFRSSHKSRDLPFALYGQLMGESLSESMGLFGFETWGSIEYLEELEGYRVFTEVTSTSCSFYKMDLQTMGVLIENLFLKMAIDMKELILVIVLTAIHYFYP